MKPSKKSPPREDIVAMPNPPDTRSVFAFPEYGVSFRARDTAEANECLREYLKTDTETQTPSSS